MHIQKMLAMAAIVATFTACKKDVDPVIIVPPSSGVDRITFDGGTGGASAVNSVYLDLSADKPTTALRAGWDLGFYSGSDFRVILNNTTSAGAKATTKFNLADVVAADTIGLTLATSQSAPSAADFAYFDDIAGDLTKTVIPAVSATDAQNPVIIVNRGTGGGTAARPWMKLRILRNGTAGYTLQYAHITETTFRTLNITKDANYNLVFASLDNGVVTVEPEKARWDLTWSYSIYDYNFYGTVVPYNFSDLISINYLAGVQAAQKTYANASAANSAYAAFNKDSVSRTTLSSNRWAIGSNWRSTQPATGALQDRFYVIKDANGNYYKLKCLSMGVGTDGGTRGKPEFKYALIAQ
jgi:hypothetical protein